MFEASIVVSFHIVVANMFGVYLLCVGFIRLTSKSLCHMSDLEVLHLGKYTNICI